MKVRIHAINDEHGTDWIKIFTDNKLLIEGRNLTPYEIMQALSDRYPIIQLEPMRAFGYALEVEQHV